MENSLGVDQPETPKKRLGCLPVFGLMLLTVVISVLLTVWILNVYLFPKRFEPVELSAGEQQTLERKLEAFEEITEADVKISKSGAPDQDGKVTELEPLPYTEIGADRSLSLTERELNAIIANNTDLADKLVIDLSDDLVSARLRIPMDPDFPFFGGKLLKARAGVRINFEQQQPVVVLTGVSVMGVPVPNAWMGGLKNIDLVGYFGQSEGFWSSFSGGVDHIQVVDGGLKITLKE